MDWLIVNSVLQGISLLQKRKIYNVDFRSKLMCEVVGVKVGVDKVIQVANYCESCANKICKVWPGQQTVAGMLHTRLSAFLPALQLLMKKLTLTSFEEGHWRSQLCVLVCSLITDKLLLSNIKRSQPCYCRFVFASSNHWLWCWSSVFVHCLLPAFGAAAALAGSCRARRQYRTSCQDSLRMRTSHSWGCSGLQYPEMRRNLPPNLHTNYRYLGFWSCNCNHVTYGEGRIN